MKIYKIFLISFLLLPFYTFALPDFPMVFWGNVTVNGQDASVGSTVRAYYDNILAGEVTVNEAGVYGYTDATKQKLLLGKGDGEITFKIQTTSLNSNNETTGENIQCFPSFTSGTTENLNLVFTQSVSSSGKRSEGGGSRKSHAVSIPEEATIPVEAQELLETEVSPETISFNSKECPAELKVNNNMRNGDRNDSFGSYNNGIVTDVSLLQQHMNRLLFDEYGNQASGPVDGIFGPLTKRGVVRLQRRLNQLLPERTDLIIDGIVGPFTRGFINTSC